MLVMLLLLLLLLLQGMGWLLLAMADPTIGRTAENRILASVAATNIGNNPSFRLKHPGVPDGSHSSDGTSYPLKENYTLPVTQVTGRITYLPPLLRTWYMHHQNDTCVTLFTGAAVML